MKMKPILKVKPSAIKKAKEAGAKITKLFLCASTHEPYEGRKRNGRDYLYGVKAECDNCDLIHLIRS